MTDKIKKLPIVDYLFITLGAAIMGIGIGVFLVDANVVPGGVSGLAMVIHALYKNIPVGLIALTLNIPLFIWGLKEIGKSFAWRTLYGFTMNAFFIDFFTGHSWIPGFAFLRLQDLQSIRSLLVNDFLFTVFLGAAFLGIGLGIIFKFKGTTAGSDIVASIMHKRFGIKPGMAIMIIDFFVIGSAGIVYESQGIAGPNQTALTLTFYALTLLYVSSTIIDMIIDGFDYARIAFIISDKYNEIGDAIMHDMVRGATSIKTRGLYRNIEREMIMTVTTMKEVTSLTEKIKEIDPTAFIIIANAHEVLGQGFRRRL